MKPAQKNYHDKYSLDEAFDSFNKLYFDDELIRSFPISWSKSKNWGGMVKFGGPRDCRTVESMHISKNAYCDLHLLENIILHEMIHVWQAQTDTVDKYHGADFCEKMDYINSEFDKNITVYLDNKLK